MPKIIDVDRLFETAARIFTERDYDAATTQEIAHRGDVNEVMLFRCYGSKAGLLQGSANATLSRLDLGLSKYSVEGAKGMIKEKASGREAAVHRAVEALGGKLEL